MKTPPILTPRLMTVAEQIGQCECFADIGTDHAYLPVYLCMTQRCKTAIASDIRSGPLSRAKDTVLRYDLQNSISLRLGSGLETLESGEADAVSIAGMGGIIISQILQDGEDKLKPASSVVLQPMTSIPELRKYLWENGWRITAEKLAKEDNKLYTVIVAAPGGAPCEPTNADLYFGRKLLEDRPQHFDEYIAQKEKKLRSMIEKLQKSKLQSSAEKLCICRELLADLKNL